MASSLRDILPASMSNQPTPESRAEDEATARRIRDNFAIRAVPLHGLYPSEAFGKDRVGTPYHTVQLVREMLSLWVEMPAQDMRNITIDTDLNQGLACRLQSDDATHRITINPRFGLLTVLVSMVHSVAHVLTGSQDHDLAFQYCGKLLVVKVQAAFDRLTVLQRYFSMGTLTIVRELLYLPETTF